MDLSNLELGTLAAFIFVLIIIAAIIYFETEDEYRESWKGSWRHDRR